MASGARIAHAVLIYFIELKILFQRLLKLLKPLDFLPLYWNFNLYLLCWNFNIYLSRFFSFVMAGKLKVKQDLLYYQKNRVV